MISDAIGTGLKGIINWIVRALSRSHINPNALTFIGLLINIGCGVLYAYGHFFAAGLLLILAALADMLDGKVARLRGRVTRFGAFFDSVLDRYSDIIVYVGIMFFYARDTAQHSTLLVALTGLALVGSRACELFARARRVAQHSLQGGLSRTPGAVGAVDHRVAHADRPGVEPISLQDAAHLVGADGAVALDGDTQDLSHVARVEERPTGRRSKRRA